MAVLNLSFFSSSFFLWCSMLKAEKQAIICTLYTQHTPLQPPPDLPLPSLSASYQNIRTWRLPLHFPKPKKKTKNKTTKTCTASRGSCDQMGEPNPKRNKINRRENVLLIGMYNLCNSFLNHIWFWHLLSETTGPKYNPFFRLIEESSQKEYNHYC